MQGIPLNELAQGALNEQYALNFQKVIDNIYDPNTDAAAKRKLTIEMVFAPDKDREIVKMNVVTKTSLAPAKSIETKLAIDYDPRTKQAIAAEWGSQMKGQMSIDEEDEDNDTKLRRAK